MKKSLLSRMLPSLGVIVCAVYLQISGKGFSTPFISPRDLGVCALSAAFFGLVYGFVRFDRASGAVLFAAMLHDTLVTFSLTMIAANYLLPQLNSVPYAVILPAEMMMVVMMTLAQSMTVLRMCRKTSLSPEEAADKALSDSAGLRVKTMALPVLAAVVIAGFGGAGMLPAACPVVIAAFVGRGSVELVTVPVWKALSPVKGAR